MKDTYEDLLIRLDDLYEKVDSLNEEIEELEWLKSQCEKDTETHDKYINRMNQI
jgi:hypothetical protein